LLAAGSLGAEKVQENRLFRLPSRFFGFGQVIQPTDIQGHDYSPSGRGCIQLLAKHNHFQIKGKREARG
jgi:hypothetical protein